MERNEIDLQALKLIAVSLIDSAAKALDSDVVQVDEDGDFYWELPLEQQYAVKAGPPKPDVGRISDDWGFIKSLAANPESATALSLLHLAPILNYLALRVSQRD